MSNTENTIASQMNSSLNSTLSVDQLPEHLKKYIVDQNYEKYTPVDQAVWRYILRQLKNFLGTNAHDVYLKGLQETGIHEDQIPHISDISNSLKKINWQAVPVSGFIPPAAFMELQSLGFLPIASDMRSIEHILYTPAPDIVHEAAGHAPILTHPEFAQYLSEYAQVAKKSILSSQDLSIYEAIRDLSDLKENPASTEEQITSAEKHLADVSDSMTVISEAAQLARLNWWTAEYGLIGSTENAKIYGAGLLSSIGESQQCLGPKVLKKELSIDCINTGYDITEMQPQLFVTPDFKHLSKVLQQFSETMAYKLGGLLGLRKALQAGTVNTVELNSGVQFSGQVSEVLESGQDPVYIRTSGPTQICIEEKELAGHSITTHNQGFGTPVGKLMLSPHRCLSDFKDADLKSMKIIQGQASELLFETGVKVNGKVESITRHNEKLILIQFSQCTVKYKDRILFEPDWGLYDMVVGSKVTSVFGGPADRKSFGESGEFSKKIIPNPTYSEADQRRHEIYRAVATLRKSSSQISIAEWVPILIELKDLFYRAQKEIPNDWLLYLEIYEILSSCQGPITWIEEVEFKLKDLSAQMSLKQLINDGLELVKK